MFRELFRQFISEKLSKHQRNPLRWEVAFQTIYKCGPLRWPNVPQVDLGREFMGQATREMAKHDVTIIRGNVNVHRDQGIV